MHVTENMDLGQRISEMFSRASKTFDFPRNNLAFVPMSTKQRRSKGFWKVSSYVKVCGFALPILSYFS